VRLGYLVLLPIETLSLKESENALKITPNQNTQMLQLKEGEVGTKISQQEQSSFLTLNKASAVRRGYPNIKLNFN